LRARRATGTPRLSRTRGVDRGNRVSSEVGSIHMVLHEAPKRLS
jgi:hypothetical protein